MRLQEFETGAIKILFILEKLVANNVINSIIITVNQRSSAERRLSCKRYFHHNIPNTITQNGIQK